MEIGSEVVKPDSQIVELRGRQRLIEDLLRDGLEIALPMRDRGVDLIAYVDLCGQVGQFVSRPIQMKAATTSAFSVDEKYAKIADLILAYVWYLGEPEKAVTYALSYRAAIQVAEKMGYTETLTRKAKRHYTTTKPSEGLLTLLKPYRISQERCWRNLIVQPNKPPV